MKFSNALLQHGNMVLKKWCLMFLLSCSIGAAPAQDVYSPQTELHGSLIGTVIYPGASLALHRPYKFKEIQKVSGAKSHSVYKEKYMGVNASFYTQTNYHTNAMLRADWVSARQGSGGTYFETTVGLGLSKTFLNGEVYTVDANGAVQEKQGGGNVYGLLNVGRAAGYNFGMNTDLPLKVFLKANLLIMFPYNKFLYLRPVFEVGASYGLGNLFYANPKRTVVVKNIKAEPAQTQTRKKR